MITNLHFENFRGFPELAISPVKQINLITGANNTGKTGILEALYLLSGTSTAARVTFSLFGAPLTFTTFSLFFKNYFPTIFKYSTNFPQLFMQYKH